jgi:hypothetical protein
MTELTRAQRHGRPREIRSCTISRREMKGAKDDDPYPVGVERPLTRGECIDGPRPCPFVSCKYHLYLDFKPSTGSVKLNFPDLEVWEMEESCALDVADRGGETLEGVGAIMNLTRERVRQVEAYAVSSILASDYLSEWGDKATKSRTTPEQACRSSLAIVRAVRGGASSVSRVSQVVYGSIGPRERARAMTQLSRLTKEGVLEKHGHRYVVSERGLE